MAGTSDQISNFIFGTKKRYDLGVRLRFWLYGIFMLRKPYVSSFSRTSGNAELYATPSNGKCRIYVSVGACHSWAPVSYMQHFG